MKVVFLGTPDFAVLPLRKIAASKHEVLAVVTQPDRPVGRKAVITPCAVKVAAENLGLKTLSYEKIRKDGVEDLKALNPDVMVTCAYGQILSQEILDIPKHGVINVHASLLPKYRGAAPIQWSIINGDKVTGVTIMKTEAGVDTGDIIAVQKTDIGEAETAGELFDRLSAIGADLIVKVLDDLDRGTATFVKQNDLEATHVKMLKKEDGIIDFTKNSISVYNLIRGLNPWPVAYTFLNGKMLKVYSARVRGDISVAGKLPGEVMFSDVKNGLIVACDGGALELTEVQLEGGKKMPAHDFLIGNKIKSGDVLAGVKLEKKLCL